MTITITNPSALTPAWTEEHSLAAQAEGWNIFECFGSGFGPWQVQILDDAGILANDDEAWAIVGAQTKPHHVAAIAFLREHNPLEVEAFRSYIVDQS